MKDILLHYILFSHSYPVVYQSVNAYFDDLEKVHDRVKKNNWL